MRAAFFVNCSTASALAAGLTACSISETPEKCIERIEEYVPGGRFSGSGSWQSTLTYLLPNDFRVPELQLGSAPRGKGEGPSFTLASGSEQTALENFKRQEVSDRGSYLAVGNKIFFRTRGPVGTMKSAASVGCSEGPEGSQLVSIDWTPAPKEIDN